MLKPRKILLVDLSTHPNPTVRPERPALEGSKSRSSWAILWSARVSYDTEKSVPSQAKPRQGSNPQEERGSVSFDPLAYFDFDLLGPASVDVVLGSEVRLLSIRTWWDGILQAKL